MDILKYLNKIRGYIMPRLTKNIGKSHFKRSVNLNQKVDINNILILRPNHRLGNLLLTTPLLEELTLTFPNCKIDVLAKGGLSNIVFENYKNINEIILLPRKPFKELGKYFKVWLSIKKKKYDLVINVVKGSSSGKLLTQFSNSTYKIFGEFEEADFFVQNDNEHLAKNSIYTLRYYLKKIGHTPQVSIIPPLDLKLTPEEISKGKKQLEKIIDSNKKTISIFTFATGAKCYSEDWWSEFYKKLKTNFSSYNIIEVLPIENVSQINFKAPTFYSKDIREIGALIANTELFIGADSGIMHLASSALTPTIGLFSITDENKYRPYSNNSIAVNTNNTSIDDSMKLITDTLNTSKV